MDPSVDIITQLVSKGPIFAFILLLMLGHKRVWAFWYTVDGLQTQIVKLEAQVVKLENEREKLQDQLQNERIYYRDLLHKAVHITDAAITKAATEVRG